MWGTRIETIAFNGDGLSQAFQSSHFLEELDRLGFRFLNNSKEVGLSNNWHDYQEVDLVLAVRDHLALAKPASKLVNTWHAGVPALLGNEPAFRELRQSQFHYIEVLNPDDVFNAIKHLKSNSEVYRAMVHNGLKRAQEFTFDRIALQWRDLLSGPVAQEYYCWKKRSSLRRRYEVTSRKVAQQIIWKKEKAAVFLIQNASPLLPNPWSEKFKDMLSHWAFS